MVMIITTITPTKLKGNKIMTASTKLLQMLLLLMLMLIMLSINIQNQVGCIY